MDTEKTVLTPEFLTVPKRAQLFMSFDKFSRKCFVIVQITPAIRRLHLRSICGLCPPNEYMNLRFLRHPHFCMNAILVAFCIIEGRPSGYSCRFIQCLWEFQTPIGIHSEIHIAHNILQGTYTMPYILWHTGIAGIMRLTLSRLMLSTSEMNIPVTWRNICTDQS